MSRVQVCQQGPDRGADAGEHLHLHPRDREDPLPCPPDPVSARLVLQEPVQVAQEGVQDHPANTLPLGAFGQGKNVITIRTNFNFKKYFSYV